MGYLGEEARTAGAIDGEGWLHTGDIGKFDEVRCIVSTLQDILQKFISVCTCVDESLELTSCFTL